MIPPEQALVADILQALHTNYSRNEAIHDAGVLIYKLSQAGYHIVDSLV